ncbi:hypothetical protein AK812_SmicGene11118 [Symbiodinium microadriaticum]|uniref:PDZ domain-containing protein n=1 Tax=Symbiodinium microadriaticum TaxID=2951 RepID=A0A1Q9EE23_SYMMI|nr:hypothetical protein AK812_SmicGene11118 [Symbiodinium microadriaticum]
MALRILAAPAAVPVAKAYVPTWPPVVQPCHAKPPLPCGASDPLATRRPVVLCLIHPADDGAVFSNARCVGHPDTLQALRAAGADVQVLRASCLCQGKRLLETGQVSAPDSELGLDVSHEPGGKVLRVDGIRPTGAVKAWNQQCLASSTPEQAIAVGDKITSVNNVAADPVKMLKACVSQQTLSLEIEREGPNTSPVRSGVLRAEATEFIPRTGLEVPNIADE